MILLCNFSLSCLLSFYGNFCNNFRIANGTIQFPSLCSSVLVSDFDMGLCSQLNRLCSSSSCSLLTPPGTLDPTSSVGMWDNSERNPLETAGLEQWEIIFEQKNDIFYWYFFLQVQNLIHFRIFLDLFANSFELICSKAR